MQIENLIWPLGNTLSRPEACAHRASEARAPLSFMRGFMAIFLAFCLGLTGCASRVSVGTHGGTMAEATSFKPPQGMAGIYVIRKGGIVGAAVAWKYDLDLVPLAELRPRTCVYVAVPAGDHYLRTTGSKKGQPIHAEAGKNYFCLVNNSSFSGGFITLSEKEGEAYVKKYMKK